MPPVEKNQTNLAKCFCPNCPTYNNCAKKKNQKLFCAQAVGKNSCDFKMNGCLCGACPVHEEYKLKGFYYCVKGPAK